MSQRSIFDEDEVPVRPTKQPDSWPARWRRAIENPPAGACPPCGGSGWSALIIGGGEICARCGGSGRQRTNKRAPLL